MIWRDRILAAPYFATGLCLLLVIVSSAAFTGCGVPSPKPASVSAPRAAVHMPMRLAAAAACGFPIGCFAAKTLNGACVMSTCYCPKVCGHKALHPIWAEQPEGCNCDV